MIADKRIFKMKKKIYNDLPLEAAAFLARLPVIGSPK
jgi:hypothetical protein